MKFKVNFLTLIILIILIILISSIITGCSSTSTEDTGYLAPLSQRIDKGEIEPDHLVLDVSLPYQVKDSNLIVIGELQPEVLSNETLSIGTPDADEFVKYKSDDQVSAYLDYDVTINNFLIEEVISGEVESNIIKIAQTNTAIIPGEKVLLILKQNPANLGEDVYGTMDFNKSIFTISKNGKVESKSGSKYSANYDNKDLKVLLKDINKALKDENVPLTLD